MYTSIAFIMAIAIVLEVIFIKLANGKLAEATNDKLWFEVVGTVFCCILIGIAIIGIIAACKQDTLLLIIYAAVLAALFAGFWFAFGYMKKGKNTIHNDFDALCANTVNEGFIAELNRAYQPNMASLFCSNDCPCKATVNNFPNTADYNTAVFQTMGATVITNCPTFPKLGIRTAILGFLGLIEEEFDCSGLCRKEKWYYFSDVARGAPNDRCKDLILKYMDSIFDI